MSELPGVAESSVAAESSPQVTFVYERRVTRTASGLAAAAESATVAMLGSVAEMAVVTRSFAHGIRRPSHTPKKDSRRRGRVHR